LQTDKQQTKEEYFEVNLTLPINSSVVVRTTLSLLTGAIQLLLFSKNENIFRF
jgi:hypothetical protein